MNAPAYDADVVVAGAGLAGLSAAHLLAQGGCRVIVLEASSDVGGRARSMVLDGTIVDLGAQFISDFYHATLGIIDQLGMTSELAQRSQRALIVRDMSPRFIWPLGDLIVSDGLPIAAKIRLLGLLPELLWRWRDLDVDDLQKGERFDTESAAANLRKVCGIQDLDYFFAPLLRALLYWEANTTSMLVVLAILKAFVKSKNTYYVRSGMGSISKKLASQLDVRCRTRVSDIREVDGHVRVGAVGDGVKLELTARAAVCATPATTAAKLVQDLPHSAQSFLDSVSYTSTAVLTFRVPASAKHYPPGAILFPVNHVQDIASINPVYSSAPGASDTRLIDVFLATEGFQKYGHLDDQALGETVLGRLPEIVDTCEWVSAATLANVQRWPEALPRFTVGYVHRVGDFSNEQRGRRITFAGDYIYGPYVDGALRSGQTAAADILSVLNCK